MTEITVESVQEILDDISVYGNEWEWKAEAAGDRVFIYAEFYTIDASDPSRKWQFRTREWLIQKDSTVGMIVRTVWLAVLVAQEHEAREWFRYKGEQVMHPHRFGMSEELYDE